MAVYLQSLLGTNLEKLWVRSFLETALIIDFCFVIITILLASFNALVSKSYYLPFDL